MNRLISPNLERIVADISRSIAREPRPRHDYPHVIPTRRGRVVTTQVIIGGISSVRHVASPYQLWRISLPNGEIRLSVPPGDSDYQILRAESTQERVFVCVCVCVCARACLCVGVGGIWRRRAPSCEVPPAPEWPRTRIRRRVWIPEISIGAEGKYELRKNPP